MSLPRVLHTADWHLDRKLNRVSRLDEQRQVMDSLVDLAEAEDPDAVVVAGDVFDVFTPAAEAERLYYRTVQGLAGDGDRAVVVVAGNHDSPSRLSAPRGVLEGAGVLVAGDPHDPADVPEPGPYPGFEVTRSGPGWAVLDLPDVEPTLFHLLPYPGRSRLPGDVEARDRSATEIVEALQEDLPGDWVGPELLVSHLYVRSDAADVEEDREDFVGGANAVDAAVLDRYDAAFLGHLHRPHGTDRWRYAGAPLVFEFDEAAGRRGAYLWDGGWSERELEGGRVPEVLEPADVGEALDQADDGADSLIRLRFTAGTILSQGERRRLREAWGNRLVDIQFEPPSPSAEDEGLDLGDLDPASAFREYVEEEQGEPPDERLLEMFHEIREVDDA